MDKEDYKKFRERFSDALEMPKELLKDISRVTILGGEDVWIENYQGILDYSENFMRLGNNISIYGCDLCVTEITEDDILVNGSIKTIEFE